MDLLDANDSALRTRIYAHFAETGTAPSRSELAKSSSRSEAWIDESLLRLAGLHVVVLDAQGNIAKALPFSAVPTPFVVHSGGVRYYANCAWDAFGIGAIFGAESEIALRCGDCDEAIEIASPVVVHFAVAAADWWADIFHT